MTTKFFRTKLVLLLTLTSTSFAFQAKDTESARWEKTARNVTIIRDDWGIAHIYRKTDADAVFGMMYAQAEDDFNRVETISTARNFRGTPSVSIIQGVESV